MDALNPHSEDGSVLILSLWMLLAFGMLASSLMFRTGIAHRVSRRVYQDLQLEELARAAMVSGRGVFLTHAPDPAAATESWRTNLARFKDHDESDGQWSLTRWAENPAGGPPELAYGMDDETAKVNVNLAPRDILARLLPSNPDVVDALLEWRDPVRGPAAASAYSVWGYQARGGPFRSMEELALVRGMTGSLFQDLNAVATVYTSGRVNLNTASQRVLAALGLPVSLADKIVRFRSGADGLDGTADDTPFQSPSGVLAALKNVASLSAGEEAALTDLMRQDRLTTDVEQLHMTVLATLARRQARRRFTIVLSSRGRGDQIVRWSEGL